MLFGLLPDAEAALSLFEEKGEMLCTDACRRLLKDRRGERQNERY